MTGLITCEGLPTVHNEDYIQARPRDSIPILRRDGHVIVIRVRDCQTFVNQTAKVFPSFAEIFIFQVGIPPLLKFNFPLSFFIDSAVSFLGISDGLPPTPVPPTPVFVLQVDVETHL